MVRAQQNNLLTRARLRMATRRRLPMLKKKLERVRRKNQILTMTWTASNAGREGTTQPDSVPTEVKTRQTRASQAKEA
jgi:hypothetical protein